MGWFTRNQGEGYNYHSAMRLAAVTNVRLADKMLTVELTDSRVLSVPIAWFPRLLHGTVKERNNWRLIGAGRGICWPDLDEDTSVEGLLAGKASGESQSPFKKWLDSRPANRKSY